MMQVAQLARQVGEYIGLEEAWLDQLDPNVA
jgi:hypothetical protein